MTNIKKGCLLIADIGGYTKYLSGVELEHSQDILADLIGAVVENLTHAFRLAKLEGDAVFCYSEDERPDPSMLLAAIDATFFSFMRKQRNIESLTTCTCNACSRIPQLHLKFVVHHGSYIEHEIAGNRELVGPDVIAVHRLLKNDIISHTGIKGYAFISEACAQLAGLDCGTLGFVEYRESYDDVGDIGGYIVDLEKRWKAAEARTAVYLGAGDAWTEMAGELDAPPAIVWEYVTSAQLQQEWVQGVLSMKESSTGGIRGAGTTVHCFHGPGMEVEMEIVDWKPFHYFTTMSRGMGMPDLHWTTELEPLEGGGTRVTRRGRPVDPATTPQIEQMREMFDQTAQASFEALTKLLAEREDETASAG